MFSFQVGNTTFHLLPLMVSIFILFAIFAFSFILRLVQLKSMKKLCLAGEYEKSILLAKKLLKFYTRSYNLFRGKSTRSSIEGLHIWFAINYLGLSKYDMFWEHINKVDEQKDIKYSWIATYYVFQKDVEQIKHYARKIEQTEEMKNTVALLNGVILCEEGKTDEGKRILNLLLPKLSFALTKQIVLDYTA